MKKLTVLLVSLFFVTISWAQTQQAIKLTNRVSQKEIIIQENKRIRLKTVDGRKISGPFRMEDNVIVINKERLELSDIEYLKRHPLVASALTTGGLVYGGSVMAGMGVILGLFADPAAYLLAIPAAGMIYTGIKSPNFYKKYKMDSDWRFELIAIGDPGLSTPSSQN